MDENTPHSRFTWSQVQQQLVDDLAESAIEGIRVNYHLEVSPVKTELVQEFTTSRRANKLRVDGESDLEIDARRRKQRPNENRSSRIQYPRNRYFGGYFRERNTRRNYNGHVGEKRPRGMGRELESGTSKTCQTDCSIAAFLKVCSARTQVIIRKKVFYPSMSRFKVFSVFYYA